MSNKIYNRTIDFIVKNGKTKEHEYRKLIKQEYKSQISDILLPERTIEYAVKDAILAYKASQIAYNKQKFRLLSAKIHNKLFELRKQKIGKKEILKKLIQEFSNKKLIKTIICKDITRKRREITPNLTGIPKFRNKNQSSFSIGINKNSLRDGFLYKSNMKKIFGKNNKLCIKKLKNLTSVSDFRLSFNKNMDKFYICLIKKSNETKIPNREIISLDPGVRTFLTFYDGKSYGELGKNFTKKLSFINKRIDELREKMNKLTNKFYKKSNLKRAISRLENKKKGLVKNLHYKIISFLTQYKTIFLPKFNVKNMLTTLPAKVSRNMSDLCHFKFRLRLIEKIRSLKNIKLILCNEAYTTKTCTSCGKINDPGMSKTYKCRKCKLVIDRDVNAARNIYLRTFTLAYRPSQ